MSSIPTEEHIIENKICKQCSVSFPVTDKDIEFYNKISPVFSGKKYSIPTPTLCPDCRQQRRLSFRNIRKLYKRKCDITGKEIISIYSPKNIIPVYSHEIWWSDAYDPVQYGQDFDFTKSFSEQFHTLMKKVPLCPVSAEYTLQENCEYSNSAGPGKNYYMTFEVAFSENIFYSYNIWNCKNIIDSSYCNRSENCYSCINCNDCMSSKYLFQCDNCSNSQVLDNCKNCEYCTDCSGLENKKYFFKNTDYGTLENYQKAIVGYNINKINANHSQNGKFFGNENVVGFNATNSKNSYQVVDVSDVENCKYCSNIFGTNNCYDFYSWGENTNYCYELQQSGRNIYNSSFLWLCGLDMSDSYYSFHCIQGVSHLFGCIGLRNKSYCILNKQYTKEEYEVLAPRIIEHMQKTGEWGEFFPSSLSPFGYNETVAQEYFPLTKSEALKGHPEFISGSSNGKKDEDTETSSVGQPRFNWSDYEAPFPKVEKIIPAAKLPEDITQIPDDILNWAIECEVTKKPFRIISQELEFYRKHNISIPRRHPDQRHADRMKMRNP